MSFGGTVTRGRRGAGSAGARGPGGSGGEPPVIPRGSAAQGSSDSEVDWERVAVFGTGIALGAVVGAGVALLFAPWSGEETRAAIARRGVWLAHQGRDTWDDLRDELQWAARRGKRRIGRRVQRARWAAEDFIDDRRRPHRWRGKGASAGKTDRKTELKAFKAKPVEIDEQAVQEIVDSMC
jgi:hypothetical protein